MFSPGLVYDLDEATYHSATDSLSSSGAKTILRSPAKFRWEQQHPKHSDAFDVGSYTHALVLGQDTSQFEVKLDGRTTEGKEQKARIDEGKVVALTPTDWRLAQDMAGKVLANKRATELLAEGHAEVSAYALDPTTGVNLRGRFDFLRSDNIIVDLKTARDAERNTWASQGAGHMVHLQAAHYTLIADELGLNPPRFIFIVVAKEPPFLMSFVELDTASMTAGYQLCQAAYEMYRDCMAMDIWPQWFDTDDDIVKVSLPDWALTRASNVQQD